METLNTLPEELRARLPRLEADLRAAGLSGIEREVIDSAQPYLLAPGLEIPVADQASLLALKVLAGRPKDHQDIEALVAIATDSSLRRVRYLLDLIERRGFHRDRDLIGDFEAHLKKKQGRRT